MNFASGLFHYLLSESYWAIMISSSKRNPRRRWISHSSSPPLCSTRISDVRPATPQYSPLVDLLSSSNTSTLGNNAVAPHPFTCRKTKYFRTMKLGRGRYTMIPQMALNHRPLDLFSYRFPFPCNPGAFPHPPSLALSEEWS